MAALTADIRLIVGLGNPGADYVDTRHNAGFWLIDLIAAERSLNFRFEKRYNADQCKFRAEGRDVYLLKPQNFMNRSGQAVAALARYYKINPEQILVLHDELDLPPGTNRIKQAGGHGGQFEHAGILVGWSAMAVWCDRCRSGCVLTGSLGDGGCCGSGPVTCDGCGWVAGQVMSPSRPIRSRLRAPARSSAQLMALTSPRQGILDWRALTCPTLRSARARCR